jgi:lysozyme family protein
MTLFEPAFKYVLLREGGIEENPNDPGGITNYGISFRTLKETPQERLRLYSIPIYVTTDTIRDLTLEQAHAFYKGEYWSHAPFEKIKSQDVVNYLFDACVNMGISPGIKCVQRAYWAVVRNRHALLDDGILGLMTLEAINSVSSTFLLAAMRSERAGICRLRAELNADNKSALDEWLERSYNKIT